MRIDLHSHSTVSDGTEPPDVVVAQARANGVDVLALTEHDVAPWLDPAARRGWLAALDAAARCQVTLVPGAEVSCHWWDHGMRRSAHLLALLFREDDALRAALDGVLWSRSTRMETMIARIVADRGPVISLTDVLAVARRAEVPVGSDPRGSRGDPVLGRPHLAQALADTGLCTYEEAFGDEWLGSGGPYYVRKASVPLEEAVGLVREAGGVTVLAHPGRRGYHVPDPLIRRLADAGLDGIEANHPWHDAAERTRLTRLGADCGLLVTGGSDYHGAFKAERLGERLTDPEVYFSLVALAADRGGLGPVPPGE